VSNLYRIAGDLYLGDSENHSCSFLLDIICEQTSLNSLVQQDLPKIFFSLYCICNIPQTSRYYCKSSGFTFPFCAKLRMKNASKIFERDHHIYYLVLRTESATGKVVKCFVILKIESCSCY
jgi:hypothetical protein